MQNIMYEICGLQVDREVVNLASDVMTHTINEEHTDGTLSYETNGDITFEDVLREYKHSIGGGDKHAFTFVMDINSGTHTLIDSWKQGHGHVIFTSVRGKGYLKLYNAYLHKVTGHISGHNFIEVTFRGEIDEE